MCNRGGTCSRCIFRARCGGCSHCEARFCDQHCSTCSALCPQRKNGAALIHALGGADFTLKPNNTIQLPGHIPVLPDHLNDPIPIDVVGVHGGNLFARNGSRVNKGYLTKGVHGALNLPEGIRPVIEFYVRDRTLEGFWDNRSTVYDQLHQLRPHAVISPNFSLYDDTPRMDHLYNLKRSVTVYNEMRAVELPAIPDVAWHGPDDLNVWIREINRVNIPVISFSFQVVDVRLKASHLWATYLTGFRYLCKRIPPETHIVLAGITSPDRLQQIHRHVPQQLTVLNQSAYVQSRRGMRSEGRLQDPDTPRSDLLVANIKYFDQAYDAMNAHKKERESIA